MIGLLRTSGIRLAFAWAVVLSPVAALGQDAEQENLGVSRNARGPAVAGRAPGLWVRNALDGPEITQTQEEAETPSRLQGVYIDLLDAVFAELNLLIPQLPSILNPDGGGGGGVGTLVITEIANNGTNSFVEVYNPGGVRIELDDWAFCKLGTCSGPNELVGQAMESDDVRVFQLGGLRDPNDDFVNGLVSLEVDDSLGELALYNLADAGSRVPEDEPGAIRGYARWSEQPIQSFGLEDVAVEQGRWGLNTSIESSLPNQAFQLRADSVNVGGRAEDFIVVSFESNSLGDLTNPASDESGTTEGDGSTPTSP